MLRPSTYTISILILLLLASACRRAAEPALTLPPTISGQAVQHPVDSARLRAVMQELRTMDAPGLPQELIDPSAAAADIERAVEIGRQLSVAADRIASLASQVGLEQTSQATFLELADRLRQNADALAARGIARQLDGIEDSFTAIEQTCTACHELFRTPGPANTTNSLPNRTGPER